MMTRTPLLFVALTFFVFFSESNALQYTDMPVCKESTLSLLDNYTLTFHKFHASLFEQKWSRLSLDMDSGSNLCDTMAKDATAIELNVGNVMRWMEVRSGLEPPLSPDFSKMIYHL